MTREEAIKMLEYLATDTTGALAGWKGDYAQFLVRVIDSLDMAIAALREQPKWISVEERLPVPNTLVLVTWHRVEKELRIGFGRLQQHGVWYVSNEGMPKVTHWMPLPEGPEVEV